MKTIIIITFVFFNWKSHEITKIKLRYFRKPEIFSLLFFFKKKKLVKIWPKKKGWVGTKMGKNTSKNASLIQIQVFSMHVNVRSKFKNDKWSHIYN